MTDVGIKDRLRRAGEMVDPPGRAFERLLDRRARRGRIRRAAAVAAGLVLATAVVGGALGALHLTAGSTGAPAAGHLQGWSSPPLLAGEFVYRKQIVVHAGGTWVYTTWWAADDSGRVAYHTTGRTEVCSDGVCNGYSPGPTGRFGAGRFPGAGDAAELSTNPEVLWVQMQRRTGPGGASPEPVASPGAALGHGSSAGSVWYAVTNLLAEPVGTPALKLALVEVAERIPGVTVVPRAKDPAGRPAVAIVRGARSSAFPAPVTLYVDRADGQLMATSYSAPGAPHPAGYTIYEMGITRSVRSVPGPGGWLVPPPGA